MTAKIKTQLNLRDNVSVVRDKIAQILLEESAAQQLLARAADPIVDPELFRFRVFTERSNPFEEYLTEPGKLPADPAPIVNVWWNDAKADGTRGDIVKRQEHDGTFVLDCYGYGVARASTDGHQPADYLAALEAQRCAALVRQILMAAHYLYLDLPGLVGKRWVESSTQIQPDQDGRPVQRVSAVRVRCAVSFNEFSPQIQPVTLAAVVLTVKRGVDGEMTLLEATFPTPAQDP